MKGMKSMYKKLSCSKISSYVGDVQFFSLTAFDSQWLISSEIFSHEQKHNNIRRHSGVEINIIISYPWAIGNYRYFA